MKNAPLILFLLIVFQVQANMAEPVGHGTLFSRPFTNQFVDIIHEEILITLDSNFNQAQFEITYHIKASQDGIKIPLLFYAADLDLENDFKISVDNQSVPLLEIPYEYKICDSTKFRDFSYFFSRESYHKDEDMVDIQESPNHGFSVTLNGLKYFETDILKGEHTIKVLYTANKWIDGWDWVNVYSFRYALSPAQYWKSFGTLSITVDARKFKHTCSSNIGEPMEGKLNSIAKWDFDSIPTEILEIIYNPEISDSAKSALKFGVDGFALVFGIVLLLIHLIGNFVFRITISSSKTSWVVIVGSIVFPFIFWYVYGGGFFHSIVDDMIGEHASRQHYQGFWILGYAFTMPIYWLIMWFLDWLLKRQIRSFVNGIRN